MLFNQSVQDGENLNKLHMIRKMMLTNPEVFDQISLCNNLIWVSGEIEEILRGQNEKAAMPGDLDVNDFRKMCNSIIPVTGQAGKEESYA
ncbi:hypothetical protein [Paenibacillus sp. 32352]|uniref:hypothetical protein n=1 Tax=Paenibacillus sp. 32352 TaxID=1969111 RepID=UPI0009AE883E|nr:hypothetical protein [Paenibacillus sp. 32352]